MVDEDRLSAVLSDFARTLATEFPIQKILDHLVERIVSILPITSAGVTLIADGGSPHYIAASDDDALRFEQLQSELSQGPCMRAYDSGRPVMIPDLLADKHFPDFSKAAVSSGLAAVFTFPLREAGGRLGALDLYRDTPGELSPHDLYVAQTLADVAAAYLHNASARDDERALSASFEHDALHDSLTDLPNRLMLQQRLDHASKLAQRSHAKSAVLFVDLDNFKHVNDSLGHQIGDDLLVAVADRLSRLVRPGDTLARWAGDEFVFLCEDLRSESDVGALARRVDDAFLETFWLQGSELRITASVGVAFAGSGEHISDRLLAEADVAMYRAKREGGGRHHVIDLRQALDRPPGGGLTADLGGAFEAKSLEVLYQPIVRTRDGSTTGVEALLRRGAGQRGEVPATEMIAAAEQGNLINPIGAWVLETACKEHVRWLQRNPERHLDVAVKVSARQLMTEGFDEVVAAVLVRTGMDPASLILEMTEHVLLEDSDRTVVLLLALKSLGIRIALDDFGAGVSSLNYLRQLPIDIIKIDQTFIADIDRPPHGAAIAAAVTNLAHQLDLWVIAEGVDTQRQQEAVTTMGCDAAQGHYYGRPQTAMAMDGLLDATMPLRLPHQKVAT